MKVIKTASGNQVKMSKSEWQSIGKTAGWMKKAWMDDDGDDLGNLSNQEAWEDAQADMRDSERQSYTDEGICPACKEKSLNKDLECKNGGCEEFVHDIDDLPKGF